MYIYFRRDELLFDYGEQNPEVLLANPWIKPRKNTINK